MGFFSDLKDDLSQAVNELMPEEGTAPEEAQQEAVGEKTEHKQNDEMDMDVLASMLDELEAKEQDQADDADIEKAADEQVTDEKKEQPLDVTQEQETVLQDESTFEPDETVEESMQTENETEKNEETKGERKMDEQFFGENETASDEKSVITEGMTINGDVISKGSMDVLGSIVGNIDILGKLNVSGNIQGNSKAEEVYAENAKIVGEIHSLGCVKIGQSTVIIGDISATSAVIAGAIKGDIDVKGPVVLDTSAIVMGNIKSKSVQINNGAVVEGLCSQCYADVNPSAFFDEFKKTAKA